MDPLMGLLLFSLLLSAIFWRGAVLTILGLIVFYFVWVMVYLAIEEFVEKREKRRAAEAKQAESKQD